MRFLLDESFPEHAVALSKDDVEIRRVESSILTDEELIKSAGEQGCHAVVFLGEEFASRDELIAAAEEAHVTLVAVAQEDPETGRDYVRRNLTALRKALGTAPALIVWSSRVDQKSRGNA